MDVVNVERFNLEPHTCSFIAAPPPDGQFENDADLWLSVNVGESPFVQQLVPNGFTEDVTRSWPG